MAGVKNPFNRLFCYADTIAADADRASRLLVENANADRVVIVKILQYLRDGFSGNGSTDE